MQVTEKRNFMDIFYINCFSHSLYLSRAGEIFHVSRVSWLSFTLYTAEIVYIWEKTAKQKRRVDTYKTEKRKWDRMLRWCQDHWIHPLWFILKRHWGLRQRGFPPLVPIEAQQRRARTQTVGQPDEVYPRSPGHLDKRYKGGTIDVKTSDIKGISPVTTLSPNLCTNSVWAELTQS